MLSKIKYNHLSYSQINTFINCPHKYKLIYIDKIQSNSESIESYMGKVVHEVLEWMYNKKKNYYIWDIIEDKYKKKWNENWHPYIYIAPIRKKYDKSYFMNLGLECLRNYYRNNSGPNISTENLVGNEIAVNTRIGKYTFKGIIDRVDENEEYIEIHDYKTGKPNTERMMKKDMQLIIYLLAIKPKYPNKKIALNWHFLKNKNKKEQHIRIVFDTDNIELIKENILSHAHNIKSAIKQDNFPPKESFLCYWCYLWNDCEAKNIYNKINPSINAN